MKMKIMSFRFLATLAPVLFFGVTAADAQEITKQQVVNSLDRMAASAPVVDLGLLLQEVNDNVGQGVSDLPNWGMLAQLPQFAVDIEFENNAIAMQPESYGTIGVIADALHSPLLRGYKFLVVGHTNATGTAEHNLDLSLNRADAIKLALTTVLAVPEGQLQVIGVGQELPLDGIDPKDPKNRRVQLINLGLAH